MNRISPLPGGRVWDVPTRLFHWLVVALFGFSWWCAEYDHMDWHRLSGVTVLGLLVFRLIWGFVGGSTARFGQFVKPPQTVLGYIRGDKSAGSELPAPGHNPLGAYSVLALLAVLVAQVGAGLFAVDTDGLESGPLSHFVSFEHGRFAAHVHGIIFKLLLALIALHIGAILVYALRGRNLLTPMLTGRDRHRPPGSEELRNARPLWLIVAALIAAGLAGWAAKGLPL